MKRLISSVFAVVICSTSSAATLVHNIHGYTMDNGQRVDFVGLEFDQGNEPPGGWLPTQKLTREQSLSQITEDAAWAAHQENTLGRRRAARLVRYITQMTLSPGGRWVYRLNRKQRIWRAQ